MESETYTTAEAARVLRISTRRVTQLLERGELEGAKDGAGRWRVSQRALHDMFPSRPLRDAPPEAPQGPAEAAELRSRGKPSRASSGVWRAGWS